MDLLFDLLLLDVCQIFLPLIEVGKVSSCGQSHSSKQSKSLLTNVLGRLLGFLVFY